MSTRKPTHVCKNRRTGEVWCAASQVKCTKESARLNREYQTDEWVVEPWKNES